MSDQDFFFDDDEAAGDADAPDKAQSKTPVKRPRPAAAAAVPAGQQSVTITIAGLIGVVALLLGVVIGLLIPTGGNQATSPAPVPPPSGQQAAPLSPEQLEGGMPPGHPDIGDMNGGEGGMPPGMPGGMPGADDADVPEDGGGVEAQEGVDEQEESAEDGTE